MLHFGDSSKADAQTGVFAEISHIGLQSGNKPEVIQHGGPEFASETVDALHGLLQQLLEIGHFADDIGGGPLLLQHGEIYTNSSKRLAYFIVQLAADALALLLLGHQNAG